MPGIEEIRHSLAHVMAYAVQELYGNVKMGVGPTTDHGFYYDLDLEHRITDEDLKRIQDKMQELLKQKFDFVREEVDTEEAKQRFCDDRYKMELIDGILERGEGISLYRCGDFLDLCRGPHVLNTGEIPKKAFKLVSVAGSYWRGNEENPMMQRIYGLAFETPAELKEHVRLLEEMKKRDHRKLGRELDLFSLHDEAGAGLVYWHPKGGRLRVALEDFWRKQHLDNGYEIIFTPHMGRSWLWQTSGHLDFYAEGMFAPMDIDENQYFIKPMNCPFHIMIYRNGKHSYRDLPFRWAELGTVYRYERSGTMHGLMRVRGFTQDDAHIFCTHEQVEEEILRVLRFSLQILRTFGFEDISAYLSTRPEKAVGEVARWEVAQKSLLRALETEGIPFGIDEGGGAFYGPKIDLKVKDAMKREWQLSTIQFDFNLPERFDISYTAPDGSEQRPYMVHRALLGSIERFFGVLIEHFGGLFPFWLSPVQVAIIPIRTEHKEAADVVYTKLKELGLRLHYLERDENLNAKVKRAQKDKTPYILVIGDKEAAESTVAVRIRGNKQVNDVPLAAFAAACGDLQQSRSTRLIEDFSLHCTS
ncbi:threonine--tRNA ligase [Candidatus Haliotispira prima]|uniref:Threonine--tRNA ligase n=1 Tax=Candidatus Haliotispira prima TaxID=3034016 RepID=A0ABY8MLZ1_9SPIO|nr:threonine--tRNA ligase [Candidatus Haliotispira prima]